MAKGQQLYDVVLRCSSVSLATILSAVEDAAVLVSVVPVQMENPVIQPTARVIKPTGPTHTKNRTFSFVGGKRLKGIKGVDLALQKLQSANRAFSYSELAAEFEQHGFAPNSAGPSVSMLVRAGKARRLGDGMYAAAGGNVVVHKGASADMEKVS